MSTNKYQCKIATDKADLDGYFSLRQTSFKSRLGINLDYSDSWDKTAIIIVLKKNDRVIGGCRLTTSDQDDLMPMEGDKFFLRTLFPELTTKRIAEMSRLVLSNSEAGHNLTMMLYLETEKIAEERNIDYVYSITAQSHARLYRRAYNRYKVKNNRSEYKIISKIEIPDEISNRYNGLTNCLTCVKINNSI